jgi:hypothetical protein
MKENVPKYYKCNECPRAWNNCHIAGDRLSLIGLHDTKKRKQMA